MFLIEGNVYMWNLIQANTKIISMRETLETAY